MEIGGCRWYEGAGETGVRNVGNLILSNLWRERPELRISLFVRLFINEKRKGGGHDLFLLCVWRTITNAI
jgi:hypothetical protein